jgi:ComF family protein
MFRNVASVIQSLLDVILPRKDRIRRIDHYAIEDIPLHPQEHEACGVRITTLTRYREQAVEDLVRALKYDHSGHAAKLLALSLAEFLREEIANLRTFSTKPIVLIPVPLHPSRERERGFNQIQRVLDALPPEFKDGTNSRFISDCLIRTRATAQQTRLSRSERLSNVENAFALAKSLGAAHVILIDDVTTTGATLAEASRPFVDTSCTLLALAHA